MWHIFIDMNMTVKELCFLLVEQKIDIYLLEKRIILASEVIIPTLTIPIMKYGTHDWFMYD